MLQASMARRYALYALVNAAVLLTVISGHDQPNVMVQQIDQDISYYLMSLGSIPQSNSSKKINTITMANSTTRYRFTTGQLGKIIFTIWDKLDNSLNIDPNSISNFFIENIIITSKSSKVATVINSTFLINGSRNLDSFNKTIIDWSVSIQCHAIGKTVIDISISGYPIQNISNWTSKSSLVGRKKEIRFISSVNIIVLRRPIYKWLSIIFTIFVATLSMFTTFLIGTKLDLNVIRKELKSPASLLLGLAIEFSVMPLTAFIWEILIFQGNYSWQLAYLAIGACPGGGHSPFWTMMLDGNLNLAVAMSFIAGVCAFGVLPFWLFTLGRVFFAGRFLIPYIQIIASLFALVFPVILGIILKHYYPNTAERLGKSVKHVTLSSFIIVASLGCAINYYVFTLLDWRHIVCGMLLPWTGLALSYGVSRWPFKRSHMDSVAIAVENGCLNVAVPTVLIQLTLPQPDADLSLVVPFGVVMFSQLPLWIYLIIRMIKKRMANAVFPLHINASVVAPDVEQAKQQKQVRKMEDGSDEMVRTSNDEWAEALPAYVCEVIDTGIENGTKKHAD